MTPLAFLSALIGYVMALFINVADVKLREAFSLAFGWLSLGAFLIGVGLLAWF